MWDLVKRLVESVLGPIWGRLLKLPWLARLSILIVILTVGGLFYYPAQVSYTFTPIDFPGASATGAQGINDRGQIVGTYPSDDDDISGEGHGFLDDKGVFTTIDVPFPGVKYTEPSGINDRGQIVGTYSYTSTLEALQGKEPEFHGFLYDQGVFTPIDVPFPDVALPQLTGINDRGQIVGHYLDSSWEHRWEDRGFLDDKGVFTTIDVPFPGAKSTQPGGINDHGQIVGNYSDSSGVHGFLYDKGVFTPIDVPFPGASVTRAQGINDRGQIVGSCLDSTGHHGFLYDQGVFTPIDVPFPDVALPQLTGINDRGQIVGKYIDSRSGRMHSFLATPHKKMWLWASFIVPQTAEPGSGGQTAAAYGWWNLAVLLLATIGLLVLSRVRLSVSPAKTASGEPSVSEPSAGAPAAGRAEHPGRYARLVRQSPIDTVPQEIVFDREELLIGSGTECDIILRHPSIAPQHARVTWRQQGYVLCAVHGGTQRTFVNGRPIGENLLKDGWIVRLGEVEFIFLCG